MLIATGSVKFPWDVNAEQDIRHECLKRFGGADRYCGEKNRLSLRFGIPFSVVHRIESSCIKRFVFRTHKGVFYASENDRFPRKNSAAFIGFPPAF